MVDILNLFKASDTAAEDQKIFLNGFDRPAGTGLFSS
jgi:hypothetical protein